MINRYGIIRLKSSRWEEKLRDNLNGKLKIVQNRKSTGSDTEEENEDDDDEQMPEETGTSTPKVYDTSERGGRYEPIRTKPGRGRITTTHRR